MSAAESDNINLLPDGEKRKHRKEKETDEFKIEYSEPAQTESTADFSLPPASPPPSILVRRKLPPLAPIPPQSAVERPGVDIAQADIEPSQPDKSPRPEGQDNVGSGTDKAEEHLDINLLSEEYTKTFAAGRQKEVFFWSLAVCALFLAAVYGTAHLWQQQSMNEVLRAQSAAGETEKSIAAYQSLADEDSALRRKVTAVKALLAKHISFKTFLEKLEAVTIPEVNYLNIAVAQTGGMTLAARAKDYTALARQLVVFSQKAPWLRELSLTAARMSGEGAVAKERTVTFDLSFKVDADAFLIKQEQSE